MTSTKTLLKVETAGKWEDGVKTSIQIRDFDSFIIDEPASLGGTDQGANPVEFVLAGLTGCTSVMIALIAKEQNFTFAGVDFQNIGEIDLQGLKGVKGVSPHFQSVTFDVIIKTNESAERLQALKAEVEKRCPVMNLLLDAGVPVQSNWKKAE
ncbi:OsmC family protein [Lederbergia galactosidilytica]|uniref:Osmotically inducible protein C n=1 Tax=Lederbergia galactosidilytica TaxID=217031 RepID=A0A177ZIP3_9BACI|nr:OsmC family protein [Lederbergia galactosidilytica]KRG15323.1 osmotically inducible protein C [Virgibacillus soli]MBP1916010.1 putative OsmC-like protein [Lederbergia galactosidilytica]OAK67220.1 osmotically inducible protein C [Lederbergia galactosidilytica]